MPQPAKIQADAVFQIASFSSSESEPFVAAAPNGTYGIGGIAETASAAIAGMRVPDENRMFFVDAFIQGNPSFAFLADGSVVTASIDTGDGFVGAADILSSRNIGSTTTDPIAVNGAEPGDQRHPEVAALEGGRYAFVWMDFTTGSLRSAIFANVGVMEGSVLTLGTGLQAGSTQDLGLVALANGGFAVTYDNALSGAKLVIVGPTGTATAPIDFDTTVAADRDSDLALLADGRLVMVAHTATGYLGRFFDAAGTPDGASFAIMPAGDSAAVAALNDGRFVVVSSRAGNIYGQVMRADGTADGAEFQVNTEVGGTQIRPHLDVLADGRFVVAWEDTTTGDIFSNMWDPREAGLTGSASGLGDRWVGTGFADTVFMGDGNDSILAGAGNDLIRGERLNDTLLGEGGRDTLYGGDGIDSLNGGADADALYGNAGADMILGDAGADEINGGDGNDTLNGGFDNDRVNGGSGNDLLSGESGDDTLQGGDGSDSLQGAEGRDRLNGGADADTLAGGLDADTMTGGTGADRFVWTTADDLVPTVPGTMDRITDFDKDGDLIDLFRVDAVPGGRNDAFTFVGTGPITAVGQVAVRQAGGNTFVDISYLTAGVDATIRLDGLLTLDAGDFVL